MNVISDRIIVICQQTKNDLSEKNNYNNEDFASFATH